MDTPIGSPDDLTDPLQSLYSEPAPIDAWRPLPDFVSQAIMSPDTTAEQWRGNHCRLAYLLHALPLDQLTTLTDIGASTGFFSLSLAHAFPHLSVTACEPDKTRAKFIRTIASAFRLPNLEVIPKYVTLRSLAGFQRKDAALLLNVLHRAGYDFETTLPRTRAAFAEYAMDYLAALAGKRDYLAFQMGTFWGDHTSAPLVPGNNRFDMLRYVSALLVNSGWTICRVAYPTRLEGAVLYRDLPEMVAGTLNDDPEGVFDEIITAGLRGFELDQLPGEFSRRPLFICASARPRPKPA